MTTTHELPYGSTKLHSWWFGAAGPADRRRRLGRSPDHASARAPSSITRVILAGTRAWKSARVRPGRDLSATGGPACRGGWPAAPGGARRHRPWPPDRSRGPASADLQPQRATLGDLISQVAAAEPDLLARVFWAWRRMFQPRDEPVHLSDSRPETHQHLAPAGAKELRGIG